MEAAVKDQPSVMKQHRGLHASSVAKQCKCIARFLQGKEWIPVVTLEKRISLEDADQRYSIADLPYDRKVKSSHRVKEGRRLLCEETVARLTERGECEIRDGTNGQEIRLKPAAAAAAIHAVPDDKDREAREPSIPTAKTTAAFTEDDQQAPAPAMPDGEQGQGKPDTPSEPHPAQALATPMDDTVSGDTTSRPVAPEVLEQASDTAANALPAAPCPDADTTPVSQPELEPHPLAELFPPLDGPAYAAFREDIRTNGQQQPILLFQGKILDGRNRYRACRDLGLEPRTQPWQGDDPEGFVLSQNLNRRHLTPHQRAMLGARMMDGFAESARQRMLSGKKADPGTHVPQGRAHELAAKVVRVSGSTVKSARKVLDKGIPELVQAVDGGKVSISAAALLADLLPNKQASVLKAGPKEVVKVAREARAKAKPERPEPQERPGRSRR